MRVSEVSNLSIEDISFGNSKIYIKRLKGSLHGEYPLLKDEAKLLKKYLKTRKDNDEVLFLSRNGGRLNRCYLTKLFGKYAKLAGVHPDKHFIHTLKHTLAMDLLDSKVGLLEVQSILGHKSIQSTLHYAQVNNQKRDSIYMQAVNFGKVL